MRALSLIALLCAACGSVESTTGSTGAGGSGGATCHPFKDNDPVACAANHCTVAPDGCGGDLFCDTICNTSALPASCGVSGVPGCFACDAAPADDAICTNAERSHAYHCLWQYPQPAACEPKSNDGSTFIACCGGAKP